MARCRPDQRHDDRAGGIVLLALAAFVLLTPLLLYVALSDE